MMNTHSSRAGLADLIANTLLCSFAPMVLLMMVLYAGFCA